MAATGALTASERRQLKGVLGLDGAPFNARIKEIEAAALREYAEMILGQRVFTRGQDMRERRLVLIITHVFGNRLPSEGDISRMFQTSTSQSRSLLRAVMSKYQYELRPAIESTLAAVVYYGMSAGAEGITFGVDSVNLVEALNRRLAELNSRLSPITRVKGQARYVITQDSLDALRADPALLAHK